MGEKKEVTTRVYRVGLTTDSALEVRLVRAANQARALSHVVKKSVTVEVCSVDDALALGKAGVEVEDAE